MSAGVGKGLALVDTNLSANVGKCREEKPIATLVREWIDSSDGKFNIKDIYTDLEIKDRKHKSAVSDALSYYVEKGKIIRIPGFNGQFRRVVQEAYSIPWQSADPNKIVPVKFPFGLEKLVNLYPKNIVVIAGTSNAGKTAFLLSFLQMNMNDFEIDYYSSEMGAEEFRLRLDKFPVPMDEWNFNAYERSEGFSDIIKPNSISLIDYLEITNDFYKVGTEIQSIWQKLQNGIAIIALQKKQGAILGRGAEFSLEKPRLYLSIEDGVLKIVKAKNWVNPAKNPNGSEFLFTLRQGWDFQEISNNVV